MLALLSASPTTAANLTELIHAAKFSPCTADNGTACVKPAAATYERIQKSQPGYQWPDNGGYCGSWASQRAFLSLGARVPHIGAFLLPFRLLCPGECGPL